MKEAFIKHGASRVTDDDFRKVTEQADDIKQKFAAGGPLSRFYLDGKLLLAMVGDYYRGTYRSVPYWAIAAVVFALLYVLNPFDIVPDVVPLLGFVDDAALMGVCLSMIEQQLYRVQRMEGIDEGRMRSARMYRTVTIAAAAIAAGALGLAQAPRTHRLQATPATISYGYYWHEAAPVLRIASGDIIDVDTLLTNTPNRLEASGVPPDQIQQSLRTIISEVTGDRRGPGGHILTGPVFIEGAEPGDALEVKVLSIDLAIDYGYNGCSGFIPSNCDKSVPQKIFKLDSKRMTSEFKPGIVIPLKPFFGSMGVAPASELGRVSSNPPGRHAGNLDNRLLVAGSTLYIPVFVPGALFSVGDGHAAQGDGEVDQTAIETSLRGKLQLTVRKGMTLTWPRAETATDYIAMATDEDLKVATTVAIQEMVDFLAASKNMTKHEAYQLVSIAGHVAITQLVDRPVYGVHVTMAKSIFK